MIRFKITSPLARKISPLMNGYCFSKSSSSGLDSVTLVDVYQASFPSFFAPSISFARSSVWPQTGSVPNEKKKIHELINAVAIETELIALPPFTTYKAR